jgi:hypothetical protein
MKPLGNFVADETDCCGQALESASGLFLAALNSHQNTRGTAILSQLHPTDIRQSNAWIAQFPLHDGLNLLPEGLPQSLTMIFLGPPLQRLTSPQKRMRISENEVAECAHQKMASQRRSETHCISEVFEVRVRDLSAGIIRDTDRLTLNVIHQAVEILPRT